MSNLSSAGSSGNPASVRQYDVTYSGLPVVHPDDNILHLCGLCADAAHLGTYDQGARATTDCDACNGRISLEYSVAAHAMAHRVVAALGTSPAQNVAALAILLTPEIDALLAPIDLGNDVVSGNLAEEPRLLDILAAPK